MEYKDIPLGGSSKPASAERFDGMTALIVDDSPVNLTLAGFILGKYGFEIIKATSGADALETIEASKPGDIDIILMDVLMPGMDGLEATRRIRALEDPALSKIPIIAMTGNAFSSDIEEALDAGMDAHVPKPFKKEELMERINACLRP